MFCLGSSVLPRVINANSNEYQTRGKALHKYLQDIGEGMPAGEALELVDEAFIAAAAAIDLEQLKDILGLSPEMSFAYNPVFGTARVLGVSLDREYEAAGATADEIPLTPDVIGIDNPDSPSVGIVVDFKDGWSKRTPAARNWQLKLAALALARTYDLDIVRVQLIYLRNGASIGRETATFTAADLAVFEAEVRVRWQSVPGARDAYVQRGEMPELVMGSWCDYCPSYFACPAKMNLVRAAVTTEKVDRLLDAPLTPADAARAYKLLEALDEPRKRLKAAVYACAKEQPVLVDTLEDGTQVWLGVTEVVGNQQLDATKARQVAKEMLDADAVDEISKYTVSQDRIEAACKKRVKKGLGAAKMREFLAALKRIGGVSKPTRHEVDIYKLTPRQLAAKAG